MSFETPLQPVPVRGLRVAVVVGVATLATVLLVWQPWSALGPIERTTSGPTAAASPTPITTPRSAIGLLPPTSPPYSPPRQMELLEISDFPLPPFDGVRPRWSIVGLSGVREGEPHLAQLPVLTTSGFLEGRSPTEVCALGRLRTAVVVPLPAGRYTLIGVAAPASGIAGASELVRIDGLPLAAYEVVLPSPFGSLSSPAEQPAAAVRLFARADLQPWAAGAYRFLTEDQAGRPHFLYLCLEPPSLIDGT